RRGTLSPRRRRGRRGGALLHVAARRYGRRDGHHHLSAPRPTPGRSAQPRRVPRTHQEHVMTIAIIGAGLAGASAAAELREQGYDGDIVLVGAEPHAPYERPPLSKDILLRTGTA